MAIRNNLSSSLITHDDTLELTWVRVSNVALKAIFGICYRPPDSEPGFSILLSNSLTRIKDKFSEAPIFLFGDFNFPQINWPLLSTPSASPSNESKQFLDLTLDFNLHQAITCPTRGDNTLDLLLTSSPDDIKRTTVLPGFSDHNLIHNCISLPLIRRSPTEKFITDYKRGNFDAINDKLGSFLDSFRGSYQTRSVNANWQIFKNTILNLEKQYIPTIRVKSDSNNNWFNKQLKSLLNRKKRLYRTASQCNNPLAWEKYHLCAKKYIKELQKAKGKYFS